MLKLFIVIAISFLFLTVAACTSDKTTKKDNNKDKRLIEKNKDNDTKKNTLSDGDKVDDKKENKTDDKSTDTKTEDIKEEKFDTKLELNYKNVNLFADYFSKEEKVKEDVIKKYYSTISLLDHTNKYDELKSILPLLKDLKDIPENIKEINKRYNTTYDTAKIGIIIPKKSKYKRLAIDIENGIKLAKSRYKSNFEIIIKETDASLESTIKATEELIFEDKVFMMIGTINSSNSKMVSMISEKYRVPFISISRDTSFVKSNKYSFSYYVNIKFSAEFIAKFAIEKLKLKKFAIFYPNSKYGNDNMIEFWKSIEKNGGEITSVRSYSPTKEADYIIPSKKLVGRYYLNSRYDYIKAKNKLKKLKTGRSLIKSIDELKKDLEPKVEFDAIYIPDGSEATTILLPYLALYDVNFKTGNHWQHKLARLKAKDKHYKLKFVQLLGTQTWASDSIAHGAGKYIQGAIFPVIYDTRINNKNISKFTSLYTRKYNKRPSMYSLYGYELFNILNKLITKNLESDNPRKHIVDELLLRNFKAISGDIKFNQYGEAVKSLFLMKFNSERYKDYNKN